MKQSSAIMQNEVPQVSVVLCSRNRSEQVSRCLERFDMQELIDLGGEIVLVDSASSDNTKTVFDKFKAKYPEGNIQVLSVERKGLSIARNAGVKRSQAKIIVFLDDDVYLEKEFLTDSVALFSGNGDDIGIAGGRILRYDPNDSLYGCQLNERYRIYKTGSTIRPGVLQGSNFVALRSTFDAIGGFDEALGAGQKYRCEDIDFIARALQAGWQAIYDPSLVVYHHHGRRDGADIEQMRQDNSYAAGAFFAKMLRLRYWRYWYLAAIFVLSTPVRPNMKLGSFLNGWRDYCAEYPAAEFATKQ